MSLKILWKEKESFGYEDHIPEWMLADEGFWQNVSHPVAGPKEGEYCAQCDVRTRGQVVVVDYRPYKKNKEQFYLGTLRLTFGDQSRAGKPKVAWRDESSLRFEGVKASVIRSQAQEPHGPILEEEVSLASEPFDPSNWADARRYITTSLAVRQGQGQFRDALKDAYQTTCAITRCTVEQVLEAAHITPHLGKHTNHVRNGLLLRADIHTLFDLGLIGICPDTWKIVLHPQMQDGPYHVLHGLSPHLPHDEHKRPSSEALNRHLSLGPKRVNIRSRLPHSNQEM